MRISFLFMLMALVIGVTACGTPLMDENGADSSSTVSVNDTTKAPTTTTIETTLSTAITTTSGGSTVTTEKTTMSQPSTTTTTTTTTTAIKPTTSTTSTTSTTGTTQTTTRRTRKTTSRKTTQPTTTTTTNPRAEFELPKTTLVGKSGDKNWIYRIGENGLTVRETVIDAGLGGETVEIAHLTDAHIGWNAARQIWKTCLRYAADCDYTVATGDLIEATHPALMEFFKESLTPYPRLMASLGNHEWAGKIEGMPAEGSERYSILQQYWPNDIYYSSVVVKKVMLIQMDNSQGRFWDKQVPLFKADIEKARKNGYTVLLFYHIAVRTENPNEMNVVPILAKDPTKIIPYEFTNSQFVSTSDAASEAIYDLIRNNADVIRGAFCGHFHEDFYTEIIAAKPDGTAAIIPQYVGFAGHADNGHVLKIIVK